MISPGNIFLSKDKSLSSNGTEEVVMFLGINDVSIGNDSYILKQVKFLLRNKSIKSIYLPEYMWESRLLKIIKPL